MPQLDPRLLANTLDQFSTAHDIGQILQAQNTQSAQTAAILGVTTACQSAAGALAGIAVEATTFGVLPELAMFMDAATSIAMEKGCTLAAPGAVNVFNKLSSDLLSTLRNVTSSFASTPQQAAQITALANAASGGDTVLTKSIASEIVATWGSGLSIESSGNFSQSVTATDQAWTTMTTTWTPDFRMSKSITNNANGTTTTQTYDSSNGGMVSQEKTVYAAGAHADTVYSTDASTDWTSRTTIYNSKNQAIGTATIERDGTVIVANIDPATGKTIVTTDIDTNNQGKATTQTVSASADFNHFVQAIADTLATQLISNVLLKNNLPASVVVQAFADATIKSALAPTGQTVNFLQEFSSSVFDIAGGIAGSDIGALVTKALGLPKEAGILVGGVGGNLLTQELVKEATAELTLATPTGSIFTVSNLASGLAGAGGGYLGSALASILVQPTLTGQVFGALSTAVSLALFATPAAPLEVFAIAFGSNFIGNLIGDLFNFSQPSVGPAAGALVYFNAAGDRQFHYLSSKGDNGASPQQVHSMSDALANVMNQLVTAIGGKVVGPVQDMTLSYMQNQSKQYSFELGDHSAAAFPDAYKTATADIEGAAIAWLKTLNIKGGNPYMIYAAQHTKATTLAGLISDLNAAHDFSLYTADPMAFDLAIALSGDPSKLATWNAELAQAKLLGLDKLTAIQITDISKYGTAEPWRVDANGNWSFFEPLTNPSGSAYNFGTAPIAGGGSGLLRMGEFDVLVGSSNYYVAIKGFDVNGVFLSSLTLMNPGGGNFMMPKGSTLFATASNLLEKGGATLLLMNAGRLTAYEFDSKTGVQIATTPIFDSSGNYLIIPADAKLMGIQQNMLGTHGQALVFQYSNGTVHIAELSGVNIGHANASVTLTNPDKTPTLLPLGSTLVGSGADAYGTHGQDAIIRLPDGSVYVYELSTTTSGKIQVAVQLKHPDGTPYIIDSGATVTISGSNFTKDGGKDFLIHHADQSMSVVEVDTSGHVLNEVPILDYDGSLRLLVNGKALIGADQDFLHDGLPNIFSESPDGTVWAKSFTDGQLTHEAQLLNKDLSIFKMEPGETLLSASVDAFGKGEHDLVLAKANGQVAISGVDASGHGVAGNALSNANGTPFVLANGEVIKATVHGISGSDSLLLVTQTADGQLVADTFSASTGKLASGVHVTQLNGQPLILDTALKVLEVGHNFEGKGGIDITVENSDHAVSTLEFNSSNGHLLASGPPTSSGTGSVDMTFTDHITANDVFMTHVGADMQVTVDHDTFLFKNFDSMPSVTLHTADDLVITKADMLLEALSQAAYETAHPTFDLHTALALPNDPTLQAQHNAHWHPDLS